MQQRLQRRASARSASPSFEVSRMYRERESVFAVEMWERRRFDRITNCERDDRAFISMERTRRVGWVSFYFFHKINQGNCKPSEMRVRVCYYCITLIARDIFRPASSTLAHCKSEIGISAYPGCFPCSSFPGWTCSWILLLPLHFLLP